MSLEESCAWSVESAGDICADVGDDSSDSCSLEDTKSSDVEANGDRAAEKPMVRTTGGEGRADEVLY